jgi:hypothetical protein
LCFSGARGIWFNHSGENDSLPSQLKIAIDTKMIATESSGTDYGNTTIAFNGYRYAPLPSTAFRQRV